MFAFTPGEILSSARTVRYADPAQHRIADVLDAARLLRPIDHFSLDCGERRLYGPAQVTAAAELICQSAGAGPGRAAELLAETARMAEQCEIDPIAGFGLGRPHFPAPWSAPDRARLRRCGC